MRVRARLEAIIIGFLGLLIGSATTAQAQERLGRQAALSPSARQVLRQAIAEREGRVIIGFKPATAAQGVGPSGAALLTPTEVRSRAARLASFGATVRRRYTVIPAVAAVIEPARLDALLAQPDIDYVEPDALRRPLDVETARTGTPLAQTVPWGISRVRAPEAWLVTRGAGAKLGIIDSGIDKDHPDLAVVAGINLVTGGTTPADWNDASPACYSHGTHVAGTAAALDNDVAVAGVAPEALLFALRIFDPESSGGSWCYAFLTDILAALQYAIEQGLDVVNMSIGGGSPSLAENDALLATAAAGVVVVAAAGNDASAIDFPGGYASTIAVAAFDQNDALAWFSDRGPELDVAAPGVNILSTYNDGTTGTMQGTSMATPHVAGVATLVRAARPELSVTEVRGILHATAEDVLAPGFDYQSGHGIVDANAAVRAVAGSAVALVVDPVNIFLHTTPNGAPSSGTVAVRSSGPSTSVPWTSSASASWLTATTGGTSSPNAPGVLTITADPAGLTPGIYSEVVTVTSIASNVDATLRVRFAIAPAIAVDANASTTDRLAPGKRLRYTMQGTADAQLDIALLPDRASTTPLDDPILRLFLPDGETILAMNDDWIGLESLLERIALPETGTYFVEIGGYADSSAGDFLVKARPSAPVLGDAPTSVFLRSPEGGAPVSRGFTVHGIASITVSSALPWLSVSLGAPAQASSISGVSQAPHGVRFVRPKVTEPMPAEPPVALPMNGTEPLRVIRGSASPTRPAAVGDSVMFTVTVDPTQLKQRAPFSPGDRTDVGWILGEFSIDDGWFQADVPVWFLLYTPGMEIVAEFTDPPYFGMVSQTVDSALVMTTYGDMYPVGATGDLGAPVVQLDSYMWGFGHAPADRWLIARETSIELLTPAGQTELFAELGDRVFFLDRGRDGVIYVSGSGTDRMWRMDPDGSNVRHFGAVPYPLDVATDPASDLIYIVSIQDENVHVLDTSGTTLNTILPTRGPRSIALGRSGRVYGATWWGEVWAWDSASGNQLLGFAPGTGDITQLALVEGALVMTSWLWGEVYRFPVDDGPRGRGDIAVSLTLADDSSYVQGEPMRVTVTMDARYAHRAPSRFRAAVEWQPDEFRFVDVAPGDFGDTVTFTSDTGGVAQGTLEAGVDRTTPLSTSATLFTLDVAVTDSVAPGSAIDIGVTMAELSGNQSADLRRQVRTSKLDLCASPHVFGDVTHDGAIDTQDAISLLRAAAQLEPVADTVDISLGDLNGDESVDAQDVTAILERLVGLPASDSRIAKARITRCR